MPTLRFCLSAALLTVVLTSTAPGRSQPADPPSIQVPVLVQNRSGEAPKSLSASDVVLEVGGIASDAELSVADSRQVTLYVDSALSSRSSVQRAADRMLSALEPLLAESTLEIVVADPTPRVLLPATNRLETARNALDRLFLTLEAEDAIEQLRQRYLATASRRGVSSAQIAEALLDAAEAETLAVRRQHDQLLLWLDRESAQHGQNRILVLVNDAIDLATYDYYVGKLGQTGGSATPRALLRVTRSKPELSDLWSVASARGWGIATFARTEADDGFLEYAPDQDRPVGFRIRLGGTGRDPDSGSPETERLFAPDASSWETLSTNSGGAVLGKPTGRRSRPEPTEDLLRLINNRYLAQLPASAAGADLSVRTPRSGWIVRTLPRVPVAAPRSVSVARLRYAFTDGDDTGDDLPVQASLTLGQVTGQRDAAELRVDLEDLRLPAGAPLRLSVAVHTQDDRVTIQHYERTLPESPLSAIGALAVQSESAQSKVPQSDSAQSESAQSDSAPSDSAPYSSLDREQLVDSSPQPRVERIPLRLPPAADSVAVLVTDVGTGQWGLAFAEVDHGDRPDALPDTTASRPRAITLIPLSAGPKTGKVRVETQVTDDVARVVFYLNGRRVGRRSRPPYDARLDLGPRARTAQLVVAAFDRSGRELDRDRMLINEPPQSFWVRITEPDGGSFAAGPVEVAAQLKVPNNARLDRLDFYWKDRLLESATEPPFRRTLRVPLNEPEGFLRGEARLEDGRVAEDVLVTSQAGFGETIGVELVELYVVATDRRGKPVQGLKEKDFRVVEDGDQQTLESFEVAGNLPLTLGLAIDSSSSLFLKMPEVRRAAEKFVAGLRDGKDRAFLVGFGSQPELIHSITGNLGAVGRAIDQLEPHGATAVWSAINLSLDQLETVNGRRALVVFYDGDDEDRERDFEGSMKLARRARLPVYLIVLNDEAARTSGRSLSSRSFANRLEKIGRVGGGRVFFVGDDDPLDPIFDAISEELRSHYLLTYYPQLEPGGPLWRPVEVQVQRRGIDARTVEGRELVP